MSISKSTSYALLYVLNGCTTTAEIGQQLQSVDIRSMTTRPGKTYRAWVSHEKLKTELAD
jgi:hypothetical protein